MGVIRVENVTQERRRESFQKNEQERLKRAGREERGDDMLFRELAGIRMHFNSIGALILL